MKKSMYLGPFQNKILFQNNFFLNFVLCSNIFSLPILLSEQRVRKLNVFKFFSHPTLEIFKKF
jgi:ABC-type uncharacterized transport system substrate-binding protein